MLRQLETFPRQPIEMRRRCVPSMKGHVRPTKVVRDDEDEVRLVGFRLCVDRAEEEDGAEALFMARM